MDELRALYDAYAQPIAGQVYLLTADPELAAASVHEAFARAGRYWERLPRDYPRESWIRGEAMRLATSPQSKIFGWLQRREDAPALERDDGKLLYALTELAPHHRVAVVLSLVAELEADRIALETEATIGAAAARVERGQNAYAAALKTRGVRYRSKQTARELQRIAQRVRPPLLPPHEAVELTERQTRRTAFAAFGGLGALVLLVAVAMATGGSEKPVDTVRSQSYAGAPSAAAEPTPSETATASPSPTPSPTSESGFAFLPTRDEEPDVSRAPSDGRDVGYVTEAFQYDGVAYVVIDRVQYRDGEVTNASEQLRTFALADTVDVVPGSALTEAAAGANVDLAEFLRLVVDGRISSVALLMEYDSEDRIVSVEERPTN